MLPTAKEFVPYFVPLSIFLTHIPSLLLPTFIIQCLYFVVGLVLLDVLAIALQPTRLTQSGGRRGRTRMEEEEEEEEARSWGRRRRRRLGLGGTRRRKLGLGEERKV